MPIRIDGVEITSAAEGEQTTDCIEVEGASGGDVIDIMKGEAKASGGIYNVLENESDEDVAVTLSDASCTASIILKHARAAIIQGLTKNQDGSSVIKLKNANGTITTLNILMFDFKIKTADGFEVIQAYDTYMYYKSDSHYIQYGHESHAITITHGEIIGSGGIYNVSENESDEDVTVGLLDTSYKTNISLKHTRAAIIQVLTQRLGGQSVIKLKNANGTITTLDIALPFHLKTADNFEIVKGGVGSNDTRYSMTITNGIATGHYGAYHVLENSTDRDVNVRLTDQAKGKVFFPALRVMQMQVNGENGFFTIKFRNSNGTCTTLNMHLFENFEIYVEGSTKIIAELNAGKLTIFDDNFDLATNEYLTVDAQAGDDLIMIASGEVDGGEGDDLIRISSGEADGGEGDDEFHVLHNRENKNVTLKLIDQQASKIKLTHNFSDILEKRNDENGHSVVTLKNLNGTVTTLTLEMPTAEISTADGVTLLIDRVGAMAESSGSTLGTTISDEVAQVVVAGRQYSLAAASL